LLAFLGETIKGDKQTMRLASAIIFVFLMSCHSFAGSMLYDFESKEQFSQWSGFDNNPIADEFATSGKHCAILAAPEWKPGLNEWPIWETTSVPVNDWTPFDRLVIDFTNPSDTATLVRGRAADDLTAKQPSYKWPAWSYTVPPRSHLRAVISLDTFLGSAVDRKAITRFLLYTARATPDYRVHIDNIHLLSKGEELAALPANYLRQIVDLRLKRKAFPASRTALASARDEAAKVEQPSIRAWAERSRNELNDALNRLIAESKDSSIEVGRISAIGDDVDLITQRLGRLETLTRARAAFAEFSTNTGVVVGWATSMEKVLPRDMPLPMVKPAPISQISVARNESESVQLVVVPFERAMEDVRVEVGQLKASDGQTLPESTVDVRVVGYVKTQRPAYDVDYVGWWPDPLLDFPLKMKIEPGDAQSFWIRVRPDKQAKPGTYDAPVRVVSSVGTIAEMKLRVLVRDFELPDTSPLPIATMDPGEEFFVKYTDEKWDTLKFKVSDFLADYYIDYDQIYQRGVPDFEILRRLRDQGRLKAFNLATLPDGVFVPTLTEEQYQAALAKLLDTIQKGYDQAKADGILQYAYLYGMDEVQTEVYPMLRRMTADVKTRFPDVPIVTTAMDYSYGKESSADAVDAWVPLIHEYKPELAREARQRGKKVWWYTCQSPAHPYPNVFTEYPAIELRLLMGAMTAKYQPDGFLYYCTFRDLVYGGPPRRAIDHGPFTEWDPRAFAEPFNGEGYFAYPGPNGRPIASIRLENFRDGLEDYAYWTILKKRLQSLKAQQHVAWMKEAKQALEVPDTLVKTGHEFSLNPSVLYVYREQLAGLIERAPREK
jgi:hypothetical protein